MDKKDRERELNIQLLKLHIMFMEMNDAQRKPSEQSANLSISKQRQPSEPGDDAGDDAPTTYQR
jgi:hypothetical protein